MNVEEYISSGIIESYVLGLASPEEARKLEDLAVQYPEIRAAVEEYRHALESYAGIHAVQPPPELKGKIWQRLQEEEKAPPGASASLQRSPVRMNNWRMMAMAASILLIASLALNWIYFNRYRNYKDKYELLSLSRETLITSNNIYKTRLEQYRQDLHLMTDPSMKPVVMEGMKTHPGMMATVYWDQRSKEVYLVMNNLPDPPSGKQYQLWAIVDGKPVDAGLYNKNAQTGVLQKMKTVSGNVQTFAITLEQKGGSPTPTMDQMYVAGDV